MGEVALRFLQMGLEATKGTPVNATRILMARVTNANFNKPREFVEEDRGTLVGASRFIAGVNDYSFTIEAAGANYQQLPMLFSTCVKGDVSPTTINTTAYRYTFTPQTTAAGDDLDSATVEFGDDSQEFECEYAEGTGFTLGFDTLTAGQAAPVKVTVNYLTQSLASNTKTAALSVPTVDTILATGANFYLGATSTAFGSLAEVTGHLRSFALDYQNGLGRKIFVGDGKTYSNIGRGRRVVTFTGTVEGDSTGVTRFVEWDTDTEKRMRLRFQGPIISGSSPATVYKLTIDGRIVFTSFDPIGAEDTNTVFAFGGRFLPDSTISDADIQFEIVNDQTGL